MRDIKFRFWLKYVKEMMSMEVFIACCNDGYYDFADVISGNCEGVVPIQYTGLKDKNGVWICEGDVVQMYHKPMHEFSHKKSKSTVFKSSGFNEYTAIGERLDVRVVKWIKGALVLYFDNGASGEFRHFSNLANPGESIEVIGNIYENPELVDAK